LAIRFVEGAWAAEVSAVGGPGQLRFGIGLGWGVMCFGLRVLGDRVFVLYVGRRASGSVEMDS